jgi:hypothetical protein
LFTGVKQAVPKIYRVGSHTASRRSRGLIRQFEAASNDEKAAVERKEEAAN